MPIKTRPRAPLVAHSSVATRSSLFARMDRHRVVSLCPLALTIVCKDRHAGVNCEYGRKKRAWKRYRTPRELKRTLSLTSWLVQEITSSDDSSADPVLHDLVLHDRRAPWPLIRRSCIIDAFIFSSDTVITRRPMRVAAEFPLAAAVQMMHRKPAVGRRQWCSSVGDEGWLDENVS